MAKIPLEVKHQDPDAWRGGHDQMPIKSAWPFFKNGHRLGYVHRIRYGTVYYYKGKLSHVCFTFWCGGTGFLNDNNGRRRNNKHLENTDEPICATCEGKAIGAGLLGASEINGRPVIFQPRKPFIQYKPSDLSKLPELPI